MLRLDRLNAVIADELMLTDIGDATALMDFANEALTLWGQHPWNYLIGQRDLIAFDDGSQAGVPAVDAVELPEGTVQVLNVWPEGSRYRRFRMIARVDFWASQESPTTSRVMSTEDRASADPERQGEETLWLLLPANDLANSPLTVISNRAPKRVQGPDDLLDVPYRFEFAFLAFVRAMARGRYDSDKGTVEDELDHFFKSRTWKAALDLDGTTIPILPPRLGVAGAYLARGDTLYGDGSGDDYDPDYFPR